MKRKKFLALALAGVMAAATLTACAPLEDLYDWFFGSGSSKASHGSEKGLVTRSVDLENQIKGYLGLSEPTASDRAKQTLEAVANGFKTEWLDPNNNELNDKAETALKSITKDKLDGGQKLCVDVMELTAPGETKFDTSGGRKVYMDKYWDAGPGSGGLYHDYPLVFYSNLVDQLYPYSRDDAELYAGTFQKDGRTYAAMVTIVKIKKVW